MGCNEYIRQKLPVDDSSGFSGFLVLGDTRIDLANGNIYNVTGSGWISGFSGLFPSKLTFTQPGHGFSAGSVVRHDATIWIPAIANTADNGEVYGVVESVDGDTFIIVFHGPINITGFSAGNTYFLSDTVAGSLQFDEPPPGMVSKPVLEVISSTLGNVVNYRGIMLEDGFSGGMSGFSGTSGESGTSGASGAGQSGASGFSGFGGGGDGDDGFAWFLSG